MKASRLLNERSYARADIFQRKNMDVMPTIQDLSSPRTSNLSKFWVTSWFRIILFGFWWAAFPYATKVTSLINSTGSSGGGLGFMSQQVVNSIDLGQFVPAVSLVYGKI